jgi:Ala-tRNA(Pro) deacylase
MSSSQKIISYLSQNKIPYEICEHPLAYTAMEIAGSQHVPGRQIIKSVIIKIENEFLMCILPAIYYIDLYKLQGALRAKHIEIASEEEAAKLFPDYEVGAEPPFGHLYNMPVYADKILEEDEDILFNAGTHTDMIKMKWRDYKKLANPILIDMGIHIQTLKGHS